MKIFPIKFIYSKKREVSFSAKDRDKKKKSSPPQSLDIRRGSHNEINQKDFFSSQAPFTIKQKELEPKIHEGTLSTWRGSKGLTNKSSHRKSKTRTFESSVRVDNRSNSPNFAGTNLQISRDNDNYNNMENNSLINQPIFRRYKKLEPLTFKRLRMSDVRIIFRNLK